MKKKRTQKHADTAEHVDVLYEQGRYTEILDLWNRKERDMSTEAVFGKFVGASKYHLGDHQGAYDVLSMLEHILADDTSFLSLFGVVCRRLGDLNKGKSLFEKALGLSPLSPDINNNYANLLIDIGELDKARMILERLVKEIPEYKDARTNLNRLIFRESDANGNSRKIFTAIQTSENWVPDDPLMLAFSDEEVTRSGLQHKFLNIEGSKLANELPAGKPKAGVVEMLRMATKANSEKDAEFALLLCSNVQEAIGPNSLVYANAGDAYIQLQEFVQAEISILTAIILGETSVAHFINLATLSGIKGDIKLAFYYLDRAAGLDPNHPSLGQLRSSLENMKMNASEKPFRFKPKS